MSVGEKIGQLMMVGFNGTVVTEEIRDLVRGSKSAASACSSATSRRRSRWRS